MLTASILGSAGCGPSPDALPAVADQAAARHLVLVTIDTLRADHVGAYGGDVSTPSLDRLAANGALVEQASAHTPLTRPSHVSLFTGRLPSETGVRDNVSPALVPDLPLLAEVLRDAGFATAAFVSSVVLTPASGIGRGFDRYAAEFSATPDGPRFLNSAQKRGDETLTEALAWLDEKAAAASRPAADEADGEDARPAERLFLWLHLYDPHDPYEPPEPYRSRFADRPYAGEVAWSDELVGRLDRRLTELGLAGSTLLVVTSDHGEGLGEHDELLHGFFVYESTLRVPLLLRGPRVAAATRLDGPVGLVDLYPTLLDLLEVSPPAGLELSGRSLAAALAGGAEPEEAPIYAESLVPLLHFGWSDLRSVRRGAWKYIQAPRPELYDLARDPGETDDRLAAGAGADGSRRQASELRAILAGFLERERTAAPASAAVDPDLLEQLGALGYVGGAAPAETATPGADPKDKIEEFRLASDRMRQALVDLQEGRFVGAADKLRELLARPIESAEIHLYLGRALLGLERPDEALDHFREAARRAPAHTGAWLGAAESAMRLGDAETALAALADGAAALPRNAVLKREEGRLLRRLRRPRRAVGSLERALELDPRDPLAHALLGEAYRDLGDLDRAISHQRSAVERAPDHAGYWNALGMTLGGAGRLGEAEAAFRRACRLDASNHRYAFNLGLALVRLGRPAEARPLLERALEIAPDFRPAREQLATLEADEG